VYLDAFIPEHGDSLIKLLHKALSPDVAAVFIGAFHGPSLQEHSGMIAPISAEMFNIAQANRARVDRLCRPQALATFEMPALLNGHHAKVPKKHYILADGWDPSPFRHFAAQVDGKPGWTLTKLPCSHDVMVDLPAELAATLAGYA
jgi:hypothetical protein